MEKVIQIKENTQDVAFYRDDEGNIVHQVTSLLVERESSRPNVFVLKLETTPIHPSSTRPGATLEHVYHFALSPAGVSRLARELRGKLKKYLRHTPDSE